jgi:hypothetical protein
MNWKMKSNGYVNSCWKRIQNRLLDPLSPSSP